MLLRALVVAALFLSMPASAAEQGWLEVRFFSAGHGDAALLSTSQGREILIDAGRAHMGDNLVERRLLPYFSSRRIRGLDGFFVSHPHWDHYGDPVALARDAPFDAMFVNEDGAQALASTARRARVRMKVLARGDVLRFGRLEIEVLHPSLAAATPPATQRGRPAGGLRAAMMEENNRSLVLLVRYGKTRFLFTGDLMIEGERDLLAVPGMAERLGADVLKLGHHGRGSTSAAFLRAVQPRWAVASCGDYGGEWRPPSVDAGRLLAKGVRMLRTDLHGDIVFRTDGKRLTVRTLPLLSYRPSVWGAPWSPAAPGAR